MVTAMPIDTTGIPVSGSIVVTGLIYAAFSWGVFGELIGQRTIERAGWLARCEQAVVEQVRNNRPDLQYSVPTPDCETIMGTFAGQEGKALCDVVGGLFKNPLAGQIEAQNQRLIDAHRDRVEHAASQAKSQCVCAINVALETRTPWALYAGSLRLIKPSPVANVEAELSSALSSDLCRREFR